MFITDNEFIQKTVDSQSSFLVKEFLWEADSNLDDKLYQQIVFKIIRKPKKLIYHLQRIYLTYKLGMQEQLYAALADLIWVLNGRGLALSQRMLSATRTLLTEDNYSELANNLLQQNSTVLVGNRYSVCLTGTRSYTDLVVKNSQSTVVAYDPLRLAQDYIEYSQLDEALETLVSAFLKTPERQDIEVELLGLLKLTNNESEFERMTSILLEKDIDLSPEWEQVSKYFSGIDNEK